MSPIPHIGDYREKKKKSYSEWYLLAGMVGVAIFLFFLLAFKVAVLVVKFAIDNLIYFGIGVLVLIYLIKKIKKRKRKKEIKYEDSYR